MEEVTKTERSAAKAVTFGILYGKGTQTMYENGEFPSVEAAEKALELFYQGYPKIKELIDRQHADLMVYRGVKTYLGDIIPLDFDEFDEYKLAEAQRQSVNYIIQHASTCIAGESLYLLQKRFDELGIFNKFHSFTHDATSIEFRATDLLQVLSIFEKEYLSIYSKLTNDTPMEIDMEIGLSEGEYCHFSLDGNILTIDGEVGPIDEFIELFGRDKIAEESEPKEKVYSIRDLYIKSSYHGKHCRFSKSIKVNL